MKKSFTYMLLLSGLLASAAHAAVPKGWFVTGSAASDYDIGTEKGARVSGSTSVYLRAKEENTGFGSVMQTIDATAYHGKRVRLSGYLRTKGAGKGQLWMRVDGADRKSVAFDNMELRAPQGDHDWQRYDIVLDVPNDARDIAFGALLQNKGQVWADGLKFEVVGKDVPVTDDAAHTLPDAPVNLGFAD
ncbi:hypothetical protein [Dyella terrae]|uniref:hypothetical protein n=1 Tax=Dyella terrae TaxID=522259 RepID=UPI001EFE4C81|nr:hypothetical protein [Dyella terrae]ULU26366.1 hypothetical protein DYST_03312 [Dyella terrae]